MEKPTQDSGSWRSAGTLSVANERNGFRRDWQDSRWHRLLALLYPEDAALTCVDVDWVETCSKCGDPVAVIETAFDDGQARKITTATTRLGALANLPAFLVLYETSEWDEIVRFRVRRLPDGPWETKTPDQYRALLWKVRHVHTCPTSGALQAPALIDTPSPMGDAHDSTLAHIGARGARGKGDPGDQVVICGNQGPHGSHEAVGSHRAGGVKR